MFCRSMFVLFPLAIVLSVLLRLPILITPLVPSNSSYCYTDYNVLNSRPTPGYETF
jgi:hypothetical protein